MSPPGRPKGERRRSKAEGSPVTPWAFAPPPVTAVPIAGTDARFPVRRVYCVGRNYADHALEMGVDPREEPPFLFLKPADAVVASPDGAVDLDYPPLTSDLHHEVELVVAIGRGGRDIAPEQATRHVFGYAVGIDLTRRDLQSAMRQAGKPWEIGKTFERCAPVGPITPIGDCGEILAGAIELDAGADRRQASDLARMIWPVREIVATLSRAFTLAPGDLVFTGTPEGVGAVQPGQTLSARVAGLVPLRVTVNGVRA